MQKLQQALDKYADQIVAWTVTHGLRIILIIAIFLGLYYLLKYALRKFVQHRVKKEEEGSEIDKRLHTLTGVLSVAGGVLLVASGAMMVIAELGVDIKPVLASLGIGGLAIGFGAQSLVKDVISGFFILFEDQIRVGDVVEAAGKIGIVEKVGLRILVMRDLSGNKIMIPNSEITQVMNMTYEYSRYVFDIGVAYKEDVDRVIEVAKQVGESMTGDPEYGPMIIEPLEVLGLDKFADSAVVIKARITTKPLKQWAVGREFNKRLKKAFDEKDIEIPFPHTTLYLGDKQAEEIARALAQKKPGP